MNIHDTYPYLSPEKEEAIATIDSLINDVAPILTISRWEEILSALSVALPESSLVFDASEDDECEDDDWWPLDDEGNEDITKTAKTCKCGKR
tara:strand:+ start:419 stop:694 length:276 start_codon:yes stop_codon:yes gene_type:complete